MNKKLIFIFSFVIIFLARAEDFDPKRVWLVDYNASAQTYLFRGNQPFLNNTFPYQNLFSVFQSKLSEQNLTLPSEGEDNSQIIDISLDNMFNDDQGFSVEKDFWASSTNQQKGSFINWPIGFSGILPADTFSFSTFLSVETAKLMVKIDDLVDRVPKLHSMVNTPHQMPTFIYVHCEAGCDRTGEIIGAYRLEYTTLSFQEIVNMNTEECGRVENYFSINGLEWFCINYLHSLNQDISVCLNAKF